MNFKTALLSLALMLGSVPAHADVVYKVGSTPTGVPFTFLDAETNTIQGMMVDLIAEVGKDVGFTPEIQAMPFSTLVPSLSSGKIDIIAAAMSATPERGKVVDFTNDVYRYGEGLIVPSSDATDYTSLEDIKGKRIGAQIGTNYLNVLQASGLFAEVRAYDALPDVLRDVANGRVDAGVGDYPILGYLLSQGKYTDVRLVKSYVPSVVGSVNIAVKKGNAELQDKINKSLAAIKEDGRLDKILAKWGL
ncbi:ABC transporter substrate-binding protein [Hoeflea sp. BAL378]|uniref:ABC transporter substrate-binding protein n=1 Tax=Hoeflea sp. BAL378 TaxID=1547437 RepID=UPI0005144E4B|nr:ABC transporter substrate-binding protein [Hoeflea sp. BAL378]KGF69391.1 ABC transporter substrate-binding protein [Hoeflea sp. BAL378]